MKHFITLLALLAAVAPAAWAERISLGDLPARVTAANPDLQAARFMIDEAKGRLLDSGRLMNPELQVSGQHMTEGKAGTVSVGFMQKFPLTGRLRLEKTVSTSTLAAAEAEYRDRQRMAIAEAQAIAVRLLALKAEIRLADEQAQLADEMAEIATARAAAADSTVEAGQLRLEAHQQRNAIQRFRAEAAAMAEELKPMLGVSSGELEISGSLPSAGAIQKAGPTDARPDIAAALLRADAAKQGVDLEQARKWEDVSVGVMGAWQRRMDRPFGLQNESMVGLQVSIPLPFWNRNQGRIAEQRAAQARAEAEVTALRAKARGEADSAREEMRRLREFVSDTQDDLLPMARQQIERVREAYRNDRASLQDVLRARDQLIRIETDGIDGLRDYHLARIRLEAAAGLNLPASK